jgi:hypothetical protein
VSKVLRENKEYEYVMKFNGCDTADGFKVNKRKEDQVDRIYYELSGGRIYTGARLCEICNERDFGALQNVLHGT